MTRYVSFKQDKTVPEVYQEDVARLRTILAKNGVYAKDWCIYQAWGVVGQDYRRDADLYRLNWLIVNNFNENEAFNMIMEHLE